MRFNRIVHSLHLETIPQYYNTLLKMRANYCNRIESLRIIVSLFIIVSVLIRVLLIVSEPEVVVPGFGVLH